MIDRSRRPALVPGEGLGGVDIRKKRPKPSLGFGEEGLWTPEQAAAVFFQNYSREQFLNLPEGTMVRHVSNEGGIPRLELVQAPRIAPPEQVFEVTGIPEIPLPTEPRTIRGFPRPEELLLPERVITPTEAMIEAEIEAEVIGLRTEQQQLLVKAGEVIERLFPGLAPEAEPVPEEFDFTAVEALQAQFQEDPEVFLLGLREQGRTADTEFILENIFGASEEEVGQFFAPGIMELISVVLPEHDPDAVLALLQDRSDLFLNLVRQKGRSESSQALLRAMGLEWAEINDIFDTKKVFLTVEGQRKQVTVADNNMVLNDQGQEIGRIDPVTQEFVSYEYRFAQDVWKSLTASVGDLSVSAGGASRWLGAGGFGERLSEGGQALQIQGPPDTLGEFTWEHMYNPRWWSTKFARGFGFTLWMVPAMIIGSWAGAAVAAPLVIGRYGTLLLRSLGATAAARPMESALEAGQTYDEALAKGMSKLEAKEAADEVFKNNLKLAGSDVAQLVTLFAPSPVRTFTNMAIRGLAKTARVGGRVVFTGLLEGGEEVLQTNWQREALGEPVVWDAEAQESFALGAATGGLLGSGVQVYTRIKDQTIQALSPEVRADFDAAKQVALDAGLKEERAKEAGLDAIADQKEVQDISDAVVRQEEIDQLEVLGRPEGDVEQLAWEHTLTRMREDAPQVPVVEAPVPAEIPSLETVRELGSRELETTMWQPVVAQITAAAGTTNPQGIADFFVGSLNLPPIRVVPKVRVTGRQLRHELGGTAAVLEDGSLEIGLPERATTSETERLMFLRHEIQHHIDRVAGFEPTVPSAFDEAGDIRPGHFKGFELFETDFPHAVLSGQIDILGKRVEAAPRAPTPRAEPAAPEVFSIEEFAPVEPSLPDQTIPSEAVPDVPHIKDIGIIERVRPTRKVFEKMGLGEEIWKPAFKAEVELNEAREAFRKRLKEVAGWVGKDKERRALVFRELENPGSQPGLTFNEKRAVTWFRDFFNEWADTLDLAPGKRLTNYVTHIFEADIAEQLKADQPLDPAIARMLEYKAPKTIFNPFLQERLGATTGLIEDPLKAAEAYSSRQLRVFYYEPLLQKLRLYADAAPGASSRYLKEFAQRLTGRPLKTDEEINNTIRELADIIAKVPGGSVLANRLRGGNPSGMASYNFTSALYTLWLGFKPTSAIRNLSQHTLILAETGPAHFADGIRLRFTKEGRAAMNDSLVLRSRRAAFVPGIDDSFARGWTDKFREAALFMFRQADKQNVSDAFLAGYSEAKSLIPGADRQVWIERGDEVAADTQYLYTKLNAFSWSQNSIGRVFSVLTTWSENWLELMVKWGKGNPSKVYAAYEEATGTKLVKKNWSAARKSILLYMLIVGLGFEAKDRTRLKALEYTGLTSIRYIADIMSGDFPALEYPGAVADIVAGVITDDERRLKTGLARLNPKNLAGIVRQVDYVASGDRDWLTLLLYLEGQDWEVKVLREKWAPGFKDYEALTNAKDRNAYRERNPRVEARMFVTNRLSTLSTEAARQEALRLIEEHGIDTDLIKGYNKVFGEIAEKAISGLDQAQKAIGDIITPPQEVPRVAKIDYFDMGNYATEVNKVVRQIGRTKLEQDGDALTRFYLEAKDLWVGYDDLPDAASRRLYRQQFPELEASLYLFGKISTFENPKSATILLKLMDRFGIPPEGVRAFTDNPEKYDELFTPLWKLRLDWDEKLDEYETLQAVEGPTAGDLERARAVVTTPPGEVDVHRALASEAQTPEERAFHKEWAEKYQHMREAIDLIKSPDWETEEGAHRFVSTALNIINEDIRLDTSALRKAEEQGDERLVKFWEGVLDGFAVVKSVFEAALGSGAALTDKQRDFLADNPDFRKARKEIEVREIFSRLDRPADETIVTQFGEYSEEVFKFSANSPEAKLYRIDHELGEWGQSDKTFGWESLEDENAPVLRIKKQWRDTQAEYDAIDSDDREARDAFMLAHTDFRDDTRRQEAYEWDPEQPIGEAERPVVEAHVAYGVLADKYGANSAEAKLFLWDDTTGYLKLRTVGLPKGVPGHLEPLEDTRVSIWRIDARYRVGDEKYDSLPVEGDAREQYLAGKDAYRKDRRRRDGYEQGVPEALIEDHVTLYEEEIKGYRQERWLRDHPEYYKQVWLNPDILANSAIDFSAIPNVQYDDLSDRWAKQISALEDISEKVRLLTGGAKRRRREQLQAALYAANPGLEKDMLRRDGWKRFTGDLSRYATKDWVEKYATYYMKPAAGMEQELLLLEIPGLSDAIGVGKPTKHIESLRISVRYEAQDSLYESYGDPTSPSYISDSARRSDTRTRLLLSNPTYAAATYRRDAYDDDFPDHLVASFAGFRMVELNRPAGWSKYWADDRYLLANPELFATAKRLLFWDRQAPDPDKVPSAAFERTWNEVYDNLRFPDGRADRDARYDYRGDNPGFDLEGARIGEWKPHVRRTPTGKARFRGLISELAR